MIKKNPINVRSISVSELDALIAKGGKMKDKALTEKARREKLKRQRSA